MAKKKKTATKNKKKQEEEEQTQPERGLQKERVGLVVSDKMDKTCVVEVERKIRHPKYGKFMTKSSKFVVHDPKDKANEGDTIRIRECRPLSKRKRWRLIEILEKVK